MKAVIYARYSSSAQREESIEGQVKECTTFAERNGYTIIGTYADRAISGTTDNRPQFQKMIEDSKRKLFDVVIVWKLDRFARNRYDSARYKNQLKRNGVKLISATEVIAPGAEGILLESVLEGYAEYFSEDLKIKVVRGMSLNAEKCVWNGGVLPIGYTLDLDKHLQPNPDTAPVVLEAFKMYDQGQTVTEILDFLKSKGITTTKGTAVNYGTIQRMLNNRRYIGEYTFQDITIPDGIPAIIPQDLFDRVQDRLAKNRKAPARAKAVENYLLTTKLFCGHCGTAMHGESGKARNGSIHRYYKCHAAKKKLNGCKKKAVKKDWIENLVVNETMAMLMDDNMIDTIVTMFMRMQDEQPTDLPIYEKQLRETETAIDNIVNAIMGGLASKALQAKLTELEATQQELQALIAQEKLEKPKVTARQMTFFLHRFRKLDMTQEKHRQALIDTFVNAVFVHDDKILIGYNFQDGTRTITLTDVQTATDESGSDLEMFGVPKIPDTFSGIWYFYLRPKGLERFNAARMSAAREGLTERHISVPSPFRRTTQSLFGRSLSAPTFITIKTPAGFSSCGYFYVTPNYRLAARNACSSAAAVSSSAPSTWKVSSMPCFAARRMMPIRRFASAVPVGAVRVTLLA